MPHPIVEFAERKMAEHGLKGWRFVINPSPLKRLGQCSYKRKTIELSGFMIKADVPKACEDVVLHEIAHALTPGHTHDDVWKDKCIEIGFAQPERVTSIDGLGIRLENLDSRITNIVVLALRDKTKIARVECTQRIVRGIKHRGLRGHGAQTIGHLYNLPAPLWLAYIADELTVGDIMYYLGMFNERHEPKAANYLKAHYDNVDATRVPKKRKPLSTAVKCYSPDMTFEDFETAYLWKKPTAAQSTMRTQYNLMKRAST